jgi:hypothetical protein
LEYINNLADIYKAHICMEAAIDLMRQVIDRRGKAAGDDDPDTVASREKLSA